MNCEQYQELKLPVLTINPLLMVVVVSLSSVRRLLSVNIFWLNAFIYPCIRRKSRYWRGQLRSASTKSSLIRVTTTDALSLLTALSSKSQLSIYHHVYVYDFFYCIARLPCPALTMMWSCRGTNYVEESVMVRGGFVEVCDSTYQSHAVRQPARYKRDI